MKGWIAVDLDGTLAKWQGNGDIMGDPVPVMVARVRRWIAEGRTVKIFTARASIKDESKREANIRAIEDWCLKHIGIILPVTCTKDYNCEQIWDDKAIRVIKDTGLSENEYNRLKRGGRGARTRHIIR